ncbi:MAG TPA: hypothetical protein VM736_05790 [Gemmatimonadales bacterium]|nr:hypothetical protein [Gemmatimonadales bacterium]
MCNAKKQLGVELVTLRPAPPGPLDDGARIDQHTVEIEEERVASKQQVGILQLRRVESRITTERIIGFSLCKASGCGSGQRAERLSRLASPEDAHIAKVREWPDPYHFASRFELVNQGLVAWINGHDRFH